LENLWSRIDGVVLDQGSGKSGWLRFTLEPTQSSRVYFDNGKLEVKIVDSFSTEYLQSVEVPYRKSTLPSWSTARPILRDDGGRNLTKTMGKL
jgi:hypothetical protein